jgi:hypothetical protein
MRVNRRASASHGFFETAPKDKDEGSGLTETDSRQMPRVEFMPHIEQRILLVDESLGEGESSRIPGM